MLYIPFGKDNNSDGCGPSVVVDVTFGGVVECPSSTKRMKNS